MSNAGPDTRSNRVDFERDRSVDDDLRLLQRLVHDYGRNHNQLGKPKQLQNYNKINEDSVLGNLLLLPLMVAAGVALWRSLIQLPWLRAKNLDFYK